jgi:hypothetical protein
MSAEAPAGPEAIELHFCRRCGISIPQGDIETHRARAVPGGFLCDACAIDAPPPAARPLAPAPEPRSGSRALLFIALLYVVGASTFLLVRELQRKPVQAPRGDFATARDLEDLARKADAIDDRMRAAFADLKANDERQRDDARDMSLRLNALADLPRAADELRNRIDDLDAMSRALATKTQLVRDEVEAARNELRQLRGESGITKPPPAPPPMEQPQAPQRSPEEIERERLVAEYIAKLADKKAPNSARYNAAVQLGDLRHPTAIPALIDALENDPWDLVCRAAAWSLGLYGKDAIPAIPALIRQLGGKDGNVGYMCERALGEITKAATGTAVSFGYDSNANQRARRKVQKDWEGWWEQKKGELLPGAG